MYRHIIRKIPQRLSYIYYMKKKGKRSVFGWINNTLKYMHGNAEIALCDKHSQHCSKWKETHLFLQKSR
jgi:hypothetical protein